MTVVNKVSVKGFIMPLLLRCNTLNRSAVRRLRALLFHELPALSHPVHRLRHVRFVGEKTSDDIVPKFRRSRCKGVVPDQLFTGYCHLLRLEKFGALLRHLLMVTRC